MKSNKDKDIFLAQTGGEYHKSKENGMKQNDEEKDKHLFI